MQARRQCHCGGLDHVSPRPSTFNVNAQPLCDSATKLSELGAAAGKVQVLCTAQTQSEFALVAHTRLRRGLSLPFQPQAVLVLHDLLQPLWTRDALGQPRRRLKATGASSRFPRAFAGVLEEAGSYWKLRCCNLSSALPCFSCVSLCREVCRRGFQQRFNHLLARRGKQDQGHCPVTMQ